MLADKRAVRCRGSEARSSSRRRRHARWCRMAIGTGWSKGTMALTVGFADRDVTGKTETEAFAKEGCEGKVVVVGVARIVR